MEQTEVGGLEIAFERSGRGPLVVLLHGLLTDSRLWRPQLEELSADFTVVAWDAPGCGRSSDPPESFRMADFARCLAAFIRRLDLGRPSVVGLSWGGSLALELCRQEPTLPSALVLASSYAGWAGSLAADVVAERLEACLLESELPPDRFVPGWIPGLLTERAPAEMVEEVVSIMSGCHPVGYRAMAHALAEADLRDVLPTIEVPTLLLYGDEDVRSPLSVADALHTRIPGSTLVVMPGVGHLSNVEAADRFTDEVRFFLTRSLLEP